MKKPKNFEDGITRLEAILEKISDEETPLNDALKSYSEAAELIAYCNATLDAAQLQIEEIDTRLQNKTVEEDVS